MLHAKGQTKPVAEAAHVRLVPVGRRATQMMVHMENVQALAGDARRPAAVGNVECARAGHNQKRG